MPMTIRYQPEKYRQSKQEAAKAIADFHRAVEIFHATNRWPSEKDPEVGETIITINKAYRRLRAGEMPDYGEKGFTRELQSRMRKHRYEPRNEMVKSFSPGSKLDIAAQLLKTRQELPYKLKCYLYNEYWNGKMTEPTAFRLEKLGMQFI